MAAAPRFLHASRCLLDVAIRGVAAVGGPIRRTLEDASLIAFDRLIDAAVDRDVDFLLLAGDTFRISDRSLRARLRVEAGLARLSEAGIATVAVCGPLDPASAWFDLALPEDVSILTDRDDRCELEFESGRVEVVRIAADLPDARRDVQTVAVLPPSQDDEAGDLPSDLDPDAWDETDVDYLALPGDAASTLETRRTLQHTPGSLCPLTPRDLGAYGASVVELHRGGPRLTTLELSPIECHEVTLPVDAETDIESLAEHMASSLPTLDREDQAVVVTWRLEGSGPVLEDLALAGTWDDLVELADGGAQRVHRLDRRPATSEPDDIAALLVDELEGYFETTELETEQVISDVSHRELRQELARTHKRLQADQSLLARTRELARLAVVDRCPALWDREAA